MLELTPVIQLSLPANFLDSLPEFAQWIASQKTKSIHKNFTKRNIEYGDIVLFDTAMNWSVLLQEIAHRLKGHTTYRFQVNVPEAQVQADGVRFHLVDENGCGGQGDHWMPIAP